MEKEIQHLLDQNIIETVNEPTGWVSPLVVSPKRHRSQIRLNEDMRVANQAILRRHTQHPTIDEVVNVELSGSTVFSHLDMSKGDHQLELKENSRKCNDPLDVRWFIPIQEAELWYVVSHRDIQGDHQRGVDTSLQRRLQH